ncbi:DUF3549 family protein [Paraferrimonas haliotis]|nr:DUF3549 family protein [Paraferrimonas haliotis]
MQAINTLSDFLETAATQFQVFDMGRRIQAIDYLAFQQIEALNSPYPYPIQGHAMMALVFWKPNEPHFVWFLKLPLDEQGLLQPAARTQFMQQVMEGLGEDPTKALSKEQQQKLANNPLIFTPSQQKLAVFNAKVKVSLGQGASPQYEMVVQYLSEQMPQDNWQQLGMQGLADFCARLEQHGNKQLLLNALPKLPDAVLDPLLGCLEHQQLDSQLATALQAIAPSDLDEASAQHKLHGVLRALAGNADCASALATQVLISPNVDINSLIIIAARHWPLMHNDDFRRAYLEAIANQSQSIFSQLFADLVAIPSIRALMLAELRNPNRSEQLSNAIGNLFKGA